VPEKLNASTNTWVKFYFRNISEIKIKHFKLKVIRFPSTINITYLGMRNYSSLFHDDELNIGEEDYAAILIHTSATYKGPITLVLEMDYEIVGVSEKMLINVEMK
jgi:hypothetical protein